MANYYVNNDLGQLEDVDCDFDQLVVDCFQELLDNDQNQVIGFAFLIS